MITALQAREIILENVRLLGAERVFLSEAPGRVLSEPFFARRDVPPLDNSAMDGFALNSGDTSGASEKSPAALRIGRTIGAGDRAGQPLGNRETVRIMTGAPVPKGADTVLPVEDAVVEGGFLLCGSVGKGNHIRLAGEDIRSGEEILPAGRVLRAADVGLVASQGISQIRVRMRAEVAILGTGDEVVSLGETPGEGQIYGSNSHALFSLVLECGGVPRHLGIARDDPRDVAEKVEEGLLSDVLVTSGGVSMGDFDYLKGVFRELGVNVLFQEVAQKPGKPMVFGVKDGKPVFGLPGNPVSATLGFELYVRPALLRMMGHERLFRPMVPAVLDEGIRKKPGRRNFLRGIVSRKEDGEFHVRTTGGQGSGILMSMSRANGIIILPEQSEGANAGDEVEVYLIDSEDALYGEGAKGHGHRETGDVK